MGAQASGTKSGDNQRKSVPALSCNVLMDPQAPMESEDHAALRVLNLLRIDGLSGPVFCRAPEKLRIAFNGSLRLRLRFHERPRQHLGLVFAETDRLIFL